MKLLTWATAAAAALAFGSAQAATTPSTPLTIHAEGTVSDFIAIFDINGYNCSQYNPCNPTTPTRFNTESYGTLARGQRFSLDMVFDASTGKGLSSTWTSADGKAKFGGLTGAGSYTDPIYRGYDVYSNPVDGVSVQSQMLAPGGTPSAMRAFFNIQFAGGDPSTSASNAQSLLNAATLGTITGMTGRATFDVCTSYVSGIYAGACSSRMTFTMDTLSINGTSVALAVPEPATWASFGLGLVMLSGAQLARRRASKV